jgi:predicted O-linked N-acetylglucosamine transferase (SPINDLY family)
MTARFIGKHEMAFKYINIAHKIEPNNMMYFAEFMYLLKSTFRYDEFKKNWYIVQNMFRNKDYDSLNYFRLCGMYWGFGMDTLHRLNIKYVNDEIKIKPLYVHNKNQNIDKKLKIAFVSSNYRNHAQGSQLGTLFKEFDRNHFEVYAISIYPAIIEIAIEQQQLLRNQVDHWITAHDKEDSEIAKIIYEIGIDILIDLNGHADHPKLEIFAYKPAPVQISFLGYPGTTGSTFMDYYIGDATSTPIGMGKWFTEKLIICQYIKLRNTKEHMNY